MLCYDMVTALCNMCYVTTCYIVAGCYVNCVLGYDNICYVNMLHVLSCTFLHEIKHLNNNRHTGYPALDPTANKYLSGSGWEIMHFVVSIDFMFLSKLFFFHLCFLFFCFHMCFFECKCKRLNRLRENITNNRTSSSPPLDRE